MIQASLFQLWMHKFSKQESNLQLLSTEKLTSVDELTTKLAGIGSAQGTGPAVAEQVKYVGNTDVFCIGLCYMGPKWTRTKIVIEITLVLQAYSCLTLLQQAYRFLGIGPEVLIEISLVLIVHSNENPFHHILVCIFII